MASQPADHRNCLDAAAHRATAELEIWAYSVRIRFSLRPQASSASHLARLSITQLARLLSSDTKRVAMLRRHPP